MELSFLKLGKEHYNYKNRFDEYNLILMQYGTGELMTPEKLIHENGARFIISKNKETKNAFIMNKLSNDEIRKFISEVKLGNKPTLYEAAWDGWEIKIEALNETILLDIETFPQSFDHYTFNRIHFSKVEFISALEKYLENNP